MQGRETERERRSLNTTEWVRVCVRESERTSKTIEQCASAIYMRFIGAQMNTFIYLFINYILLLLNGIIPHVRRAMCTRCGPHIHTRARAARLFRVRNQREYGMQ